MQKGLGKPAREPATYAHNDFQRPRHGQRWWHLRRRAEQAREAIDRCDDRTAMGLPHETLARQPSDLGAHYWLARRQCQHLDQVDLARREFECVVVHGEPGAPAVQIARDWPAS